MAEEKPKEVFLSRDAHVRDALKSAIEDLDKKRCMVILELQEDGRPVITVSAGCTYQELTFLSMHMQRKLFFWMQEHYPQTIHNG